MRIGFYKIVLTIIIFLTVHVSAVSAQTIDSVSLDSLVQQYVDSADVPGMVVGIVAGDELSYLNGFGVTNMETGVPVVPDMLIRLGSLTKLFTATMVLNLAEAGALDLHEPIGSYIEGLAPRISNVTAHQLLSYTAGLKWDSIDHGDINDSALIEKIRSLPDDMRFEFSGPIMSYSNPSYWVAGALIEAVSGNAFATHMQKELFEPLEMKRSTYSLKMATTYSLAQGHRPAGQEGLKVVRPFVEAVVSYPSSHMISNVKDVANYAIAFLNEGKLNGRQVLHPNVIRRLSESFIDIPTENGTRMGYSLRHTDYKGIRLIRWGGNVGGFSSHLLLVPAKKLAIVVICNRQGRANASIVFPILESVIPLDPNDDSDSGNLSEFLPITERDMEDYVGVYLNNEASFAGPFKVYVEDHRLMADFGPGPLSLRKIAPDRFEDARNNEVVFTRNPEGIVSIIHWQIWAGEKVE